MNTIDDTQNNPTDTSTTPLQGTTDTTPTPTPTPTPVTPMSIEDIRAAFLNRKKTIVNVDDVLPDLDMLNGQLALQELSANSVSHAQKLADDHGETDSVLFMAALVVKSLVERSSQQRIFKDNDLQAVADFGLSVIMPLAEDVKNLSGIGKTAQAQAKKSSQNSQESDSATSSTEKSEQEQPA